jgi:TupA-like ATPgrasp
MKRVLKSIHKFASKILPNVYCFNFILALPIFFIGNKRLPRNISAKTATINDFIFDRMIRKNWNVLQQSCVDKEYAKIIVTGLMTEVRIPKTISVFYINGRTSLDEMEAWLSPFLGRHLVAKPAHSAGRILFLDTKIQRGEILDFLSYSVTNYFTAGRETLYDRLERKIIVEENISHDGSILNDYKFFCSNGVVHYCEVDIDRFSGHKRAICRMPDFVPLPVRYGRDLPYRVERPKHLSQMINISRMLSTNFDFVSVDLYDTEEGVYFGEFTFSPGAGSINISDEKFAIEFLQKVRAAEKVGLKEKGGWRRLKILVKEDRLTRVRSAK